MMHKMKKEQIWNNPVFICGHRKTGTTLLVNLLDNHKDLLTYPDDSGFWYMFYPLFDSSEISSEKKDEIVLNNLVPNFEYIIRNVPDDYIKKMNFSKEKFYDYYKEFISSTNHTTKDILTSLVKAMNKIFQQKTSIKHWVEKTTSSEVYALDIAKMFPNAKFIHIIRDPRDNWGSLKSGWEKRYSDFNDEPRRLMHSLLERGKLCMEFAKHNQDILGKQTYKVIKFEDLTASPEQIMKEISDFLKIEFTETLLQPTVLGLPWKGNNFENLKFTKISSSNSNRWRERIAPEEAMLIEYYFKDIMKEFSYNTEYSTQEQCIAAKNHYKWYNFAQEFCFKPK